MSRKFLVRIIAVLVVGISWQTALAQNKPAKVPDQITALAFTPDSQRVAAATQSGRIDFHKVPQGAETFVKVEIASEVLSLAFSKDGKILAGGHHDGQISLWDVSKKALQKRWKAHVADVGALAWLTGDQTLVSGGYDGAIRFWQLPDGRETKAWTIPKSRITSLTLTQDSRTLFSGGVAQRVYEVNTNVFGTSESDSVRMWDVSTGMVEKMSVSGEYVVISPTGSYLAAAGLTTDIRRTDRGTSFDGIDRLVIYDVRKKRPLLDTPWHGHLLSLSADGKYLATGGGNPRGFQNFHGIIGPNARTLERMDVRLRIWEFASAKELLRLPQDEAWFITLSPNGKFLAAVNHQSHVKIWDIARELRNPTPDPREIVAAPKDAWLAGLVKDFERLAGTEQAELRRAQLLLHQGKATEAVAILRATRQSAAVPLLLRHLVDTESKAKQRAWDGPAMRDALVALTGKVMPPAENAAEVQAWYAALLKEPPGLVTDLNRFSPDQLRIVATVLAARTLERHGRDEGFSVSRLHNRIRDLLSAQDERSRTWWRNEIHHDMLPLMLENMGHGDPDARDENRSIDWQYLPLLTELGRQGQADRLEKLAKEPKENAAVRIICLWAHAGATGMLSTKAAIELLDAKKLDNRVAVILALERAAANDVKNSLLKLLKEPNRHIREAALLVLTSMKVPEAVPLIRPRLEAAAGAATDETLAMIRCLAAVQTKEAQATLANHLRRLLDESAPRRELWEAVAAFSQSTGRRFQDANARFTDEALRIAARRALDWWASEKQP